jgi:TatD DNase family protein
MNLIDTHTHLYSEQFNEDRDLVIQRAISQGIHNFYIPAIDSSYTEAMYALEKNYPKHMHLMMGLHPTSVKDHVEDELKHIREQLEQRKFAAIGEIGIDLYWDKSKLDLQRYAFKKQIAWAKEFKLPIVIHCREAFDQVFSILEEENDDDLFGIFHCFTGTFEQAEKAISFGMKLGIGGVVTFKNGKIDQFLDRISLREIVLETDSPYLAPKPYRGKRNESSYLLNVAEKVASIYNLSLEEVAEITSNSAQEIFSNYEN